jgi:NAD(P)-dependent dehydrogenase (short-subunit alcohol dehydrogenase family)
MKEFRDKVAVITGAASGIGRAIAGRCAQEGMKVVLAGINESNLVKVESELKARGGTAISVRTDVSRRQDVEVLAQRTLETFGGIHLLVNNAGVGAGSTPWESTWEDWEWVIGVNLWGVIHGVKVFTPIMLAQQTEGHIVNTASVAGLVSYHPAATYQVTKHAVVALTENLHQSLTKRGSLVKASVLCPGWVKTQILNSARNRPLSLRNEGMDASVERQRVLETMRAAVEGGMPAEEVADQVFDAIRQERLYILTHPEYTHMVRERMEAILAGCAAEVTR